MRCSSSPRFGPLGQVVHHWRTRHQREAKQRARRLSSTAAEVHRRTRHTPHDTNTKGCRQFRVLAQRRCCPGLVRYAPSPQVGFSVHLGQVTNGMFFDAVALLCVVSLSYSPSFVYVHMFGGRVRVGTHDMHDVHFLVVFKTVFRCSLVVHLCPLDGHVGHRTSDFIFRVSECFHASEIVCKRSAANVLIFMDKHVCLTQFSNIVDHITLACGRIMLLKCSLEFLAIRALLIIHIFLDFVYFLRSLSITTVRPRTSIEHAHCQIKREFCTHNVNHHVVFGPIVCNAISLHVHTRSETLHDVFGSHC